MDIAFIFPGQGAQTPGYLSRLPDHPEVRATLREASEILGVNTDELDTEISLASTVGVQLTGLIAAVATFRALAAEGVTPDAVAGLSSGAFSAAVACGTLQFEHALPLIKQRAEWMQAAYPDGYGLAALVGLNEAQVLQLLEKIPATHPLYIANLNTPTQIVLAGSNAALGLAIEAARMAGARQAHRMAVSVPSHCALMDSVALALQTSLATLPLKRPTVPYIGNIRARAMLDAEGIRQDLANNVAHTVRWHDAMTLLYERGVRTFFETPPGTTLTGIIRESFPDARPRSLTDTPLDTIVYLAAKARSAAGDGNR